MPLSNPYIHIAKPFEHLRDDLNILEILFADSKNILHQQRNVIKKITLREYNVAVKSFKTPQYLQRYIYANLRHSKARRSFDHAERLSKLGIHTPTPIAYIEHTLGKQLKNSYYIALYHAYDFTMQEVMANLNDKNIGIIKAFTRFTFTMHQQNVLHLDHNAGNTLINKADDGYNFSIIDINRMQFKPLSLRQRLNNFVRLTDNAIILNTFAETYADCMHISHHQCKDLLFKLKRKHNNKLRFKRRIKKFLGR